MLLTAFTLFHVLISLIGIGTGLVVAYGMLTAQSLPRLASIFLYTTVATSVTGFMFPVQHFMPSHAVGILSLLVLAIAIPAWRRQAQLSWRRTFVVTSMIALYFNVFVLVVQSFGKVPALKQLAPTQSEPAFVLTQLAVLVAFVAAGVVAFMKASRASQVKPIPLTKAAVSH
jgi:hypothetical protein